MAEEAGNGTQAGKTLELVLSARGLSNADTFSKSDPICVVEEVCGPEGSGSCVEIDRTEAVMDCLDPRWTKKVLLDARRAEMELRFSIYDIDSKSRALTHHDFLGRCGCRLSDLVAAPSGNLRMRLKKDRDVIAKGELLVHAEGCTVEEPGVHFECRGLLSSPHKRWALAPKVVQRVPSTFLEFYRGLPEQPHSERLLVHRTETTRPNTWNPEWATFHIALRLLSLEDRQRQFLVQCYSYDSTGNHQLIGEVWTSVDRLTRLNEWRVRLGNEDKKKGGKQDIHRIEGHLHFIYVTVNRQRNVQNDAEQAALTEPNGAFQ